MLLLRLLRTGYNQEDSVILDEDQFKELFFPHYIKLIRTLKIRFSLCGQDQKFIKPDKSITKGMKPGSYEKQILVVLLRG